MLGRHSSASTAWIALNHLYNTGHTTNEKQEENEMTFYCLFVFLSCTPSTHVTLSAPLPLQHCQVSGSHSHPCNH